jgi:hypothetical protein
MDTPNANGFHPKAQDLLDRALAGRTEAEKARALDLALRIGLSPEDELWLVVIAIGGIQGMLETYPDRIQHVLDEFFLTLDQWVTINTKVLELQDQQAQHMNNLTTIARELTSTLAALVQVLSKQTVTLESFVQNYDNLASRCMTFRNDMDWPSQNQSVPLLPPDHQPHLIPANNKTGLRSDHNHLHTITSVGTLVLCVIIFFLQGFLWSSQGKNQQILSWLLFKANRAECLKGIVKPTSARCEPFQN